MDLTAQPAGEHLVVAGQRCHQRSVGGVHRGQQLGFGVDHHDRVHRAERLGMVQRAGRRGSEDRHRRHVGGGVLPGNEGTVGDAAPVQRNPALGDRLVDLAGEFDGLLRGDDGPVVEFWQGIVVVRDGQRMAEPHRGHHGQVGGEELIEELALDDIAGIGGASLLAVFEPLLQVRGQQVPLGELPDAPGVEALLLEEVPFARVDQRGRDLAAGGAPADEGQAADLRCADQRA